MNGLNLKNENINRSYWIFVPLSTAAESKLNASACISCCVSFGSFVFAASLLSMRRIRMLSLRSPLACETIHAWAPYTRTNTIHIFGSFTSHQIHSGNRRYRAALGCRSDGSGACVCVCACVCRTVCICVSHHWMSKVTEFFFRNPRVYLLLGRNVQYCCDALVLMRVFVLLTISKNS